MKLDQIKHFFFDLDKTIWNWDKAVIGAEEVIKSLRNHGKEVYFHTDNTLLTRKEYARKLTDLNIPVDENQILTSGYVAAKYLEKKDINQAYIIGESGLIEELEQRDIELSQNTETVVVGLDRQFNYDKLRRAAKITSKKDVETELIICSTERTFRTMKKIQPHQKPINNALKEFSNNTTIVGKPGQIFRDQLRNYFNYYPEASLMIGDRLADIETGNHLGMKTAAVMSGEITREKLAKAKEKQKPDYGLSSLTRLKSKIV